MFRRNLLQCAGTILRRKKSRKLSSSFLHPRTEKYFLFLFFLKGSVPTFYFCLCCNVICIPYLFICLICEKVFKRAFFSRIFILPHYICLQPFLSPYIYLSLVTLPSSRHKLPPTPAAPLPSSVSASSYPRCLSAFLPSCFFLPQLPLCLPPSLAFSYPCCFSAFVPS